MAQSSRSCLYIAMDISSLRVVCCLENKIGFPLYAELSKEGNCQELFAIKF